MLHKVNIYCTIKPPSWRWWFWDEGFDYTIETPNTSRDYTIHKKEEKIEETATSSIFNWFCMKDLIKLFFLYIVYNNFENMSNLID